MLDLKKIFFLGSVSFVPLTVSAEPTIQNFISSLNNIIAAAIPVVIGIAMVFFFWGLVKFIARAGNETAREEGRRLMVWGIIALAIMVSIWGIIEILRSDFGLTGAPTELPEQQL